MEPRTQTNLLRCLERLQAMAGFKLQVDKTRSDSERVMLVVQSLMMHRHAQAKMIKIEPREQG